MANLRYSSYRYVHDGRGACSATYAPSLRICRQNERQDVPHTWYFIVRRFCTRIFLGAFLLCAYGIPHASFARDLPDSFSSLAEELLPAVVNISTSQTLPPERLPDLPQFPPGSPFEDFFREFFEKGAPHHHGNKKATSLGSGFIVDEDGFVVTNNHVIQDADEITVILSDNTALKAEVIGRDKKVDLALLKINTERDLPSIRFGNSDKARVGDWVMAIGNPLGLGGSVTAGIISAKTRDINAGPYDSFIQTDAAINKGNSGGPLFDMDGRVIGVNTAIYSPSGGNIGIAFATPSNLVKQVISDLRQYGRPRRGWLGVRIQTVTDEIAESLGLDKPRGALVAATEPGSPAEDANIKAGDIIIEWDGKTVETMRRLPVMVAETDINKTVPVIIWRDGKRLSLSVKVGEQEDEEPEENSPVVKESPDSSGGHVEDLGLSLTKITNTSRNRYNLPKDSRGLVVTGVSQNGPASEKGVQPGDIVVEINQQPVFSIKDAKKQISAVREKSRKSVLLLIRNAAGTRFVALAFNDER